MLLTALDLLQGKIRLLAVAGNNVKTVLMKGQLEPASFSTTVDSTRRLEQEGKDYQNKKIGVTPFLFVILPCQSRFQLSRLVWCGSRNFLYLPKHLDCLAG
jgi:hypothetical protein